MNVVKMLVYKIEMCYFIHGSGDDDPVCIRLLFA